MNFKKDSSNRGKEFSRERTGNQRPKRDFGPRRDDDRPRRSFGPKTDDDRPKRNFGPRREDDRPKRNFGPREDGDRPKRSFGPRRDDDRPRRSFGPREDGDKPRRSFGPRRDDDRPRRSFGPKTDGDRPRRSFGPREDGDRPRRSFGPREDGDRPRRSFGPREDGDRPKRSFGPREDGDRPRRSFGPRRDDDRPKRSFGPRRDDDRPKRSFGPRRDDDRPKRSFGPRRDDDRPKRSFGPRRDDDRPKRSFGPRRDDDRPKKDFTPKEDSNTNTNPNEVRLNKYVANSGVCSRREADELIEAGLITVNGVVITELGTKVNITDDIRYNDQRLKGEAKVYIIMNKPKDFVTTISDPNADKSVMDLINPELCPERVYPIGRLDKSTTGVLLFTNDGELSEKLTHPSYQRKKIYQVTLDKNLKKSDFNTLLEGVQLEDGFVAADALSYVGEKEDQVGLEIHSGHNRIVRRMFEHIGYDVKKLDRVYFAGLTKKNIRRGQWRFLTESEVNILKMGSYE